MFENLKNFINIETNGKYCIAHTNSNNRILKKMELCPKTSFYEISPNNFNAALKYSCGNKQVSSQIRVTKRTKTLILEKRLKKGMEITPDNAYFEDRFTSKEYTMPDLSSRLVTRNDLESKSILSKRNTKIIPDVMAGDIITNKQEGKGFILTRNIKALENGYKGDTIDVYDKKKQKAIIMKNNGEITLKIIIK
jgi:flagella basal body P-ring formation protein FlgA